jgi:hypothetical protein
MNPNCREYSRFSGFPARLRPGDGGFRLKMNSRLNFMTEISAQGLIHFLVSTSPPPAESSAHAAAVGLRGAADQDHRPAVLLSIGKTRETVHHAWAGNGEAGAGAAGEIAVGPCRIGALCSHGDLNGALQRNSRTPSACCVTSITPAEFRSGEQDHAFRRKDPMATLIWQSFQKAGRQ